MIRKLRHINIFFLSKREDNNANLFLGGFVLYVAGYMLSVTNTVDVVMCQALQGGGILLMVPFAAMLSKFKFENEYLKTVYIVFLLWTIGIIGRGIKTDYNSLKELLFDPIIGITSYLVPVVLLFPKNLSFYKKIFTVILIFAAFYVLLVIIFFKDMRSYAAIDPFSQSLIENFATLGKTTEFLLMTYLFHKRPKKIFAIVAGLITIYFAIVRARRGLLLTCGLTLTTCFLLYLSTTRQKILAVILSVILAAGAFMYMQAMSGNGIFTFLMARKDEDTRSNVEQSLIADMNRVESYVGRGINGQYYCPGVVNAINGTSYRTVIETGYLQIILKGGKIYLILFGLIMIPAVIKGLFYSKNIFAKGAALWILLWMFYLYPVIGTGFGLYYIIVWLSVGICYSDRIRELSNSQIQSVLLR